MLIFDGKVDIKGDTPAAIIRQMRARDARHYYFNSAYMKAVAKRFEKWHGRAMIYTNSLTWLEEMAWGKHITIIK